MIFAQQPRPNHSCAVANSTALQCNSIGERAILREMKLALPNAVGARRVFSDGMGRAGSAVLCSSVDTQRRTANNLSLDVYPAFISSKQFLTRGGGDSCRVCFCCRRHLQAALCKTPNRSATYGTESRICARGNPWLFLSVKVILQRGTVR